MSCTTNQLVIFELRNYIDDMTGSRADVKNRRAELKEVIYFARVNNSWKLIAPDNDVQVRGRQRHRHVAQWLIRKTKYVSQFVLFGIHLHLFVLAAAARKTKSDVCLVLQLAGRAEQSIQRMTGTMVSRVHHHKLLRQIMGGAKSSAARSVICNRFGVRPGRNHRQLFFRDALVNNPLLHEAIEDDDAFRMSQAVAQEAKQRPCRKRLFLKPTGGDGFVRIEVHHPE